MSRLLHLAAPADLTRLLPMVEAFHAFAGIESDAATREAAVAPLLEGSPLGAIWLIGPKIAPVGYVALSFGWSIARGGMEAAVDEIFVREKVRGRGMGTEALVQIVPSLAEAGLRALNFAVPPEDTRLRRLCERAGLREARASLMTWSAADAADAAEPRRH